MRTVLAASVLAAAAISGGEARAQMPVTDASANVTLASQLVQGAHQLSSLVQQIQLMQAQLMQLQQVYSSITHLPDTLLNQAGAALNDPSIRNPMPSSSSLGSLFSGTGNLGGLSAAGQGFLDSSRVYSPTGSDSQAMLMGTNANSIAGVKAVANQLYQSADDHTRLLQNLEGALANAPDAKGVADIQGRIALEQSYIANRQVQANALGTWQGAQVRTTEQQQIELRRCHYEQAFQIASANTLFSGPAPDTCSQAVAAMASGGGAGSPGSDGGGTPGSGGGLAADGGSNTNGQASNASQYVGQSVGSGQCVALVQTADPSVGLTKTWAAGDAVQGNTNIAPGTPIATFDSNGSYGNHTDGSSHAAIYLGQSAAGLQVEDQWLGTATHVHTIPWSGVNAANSGTRFQVINKA